MTLTDFLLARIAEDETAEIHDLAVCSWANDTAAGVACDCDVPARKLAECDAKRRVVALAIRRVRPELADRFMRALALPYASHPEYDITWAADAVG